MCVVSAWLGTQSHSNEMQAVNSAWDRIAVGLIMVAGLTD